MPLRTKFNERYHAAMTSPILSSEQRDLIYGALQRSGGTMTGDLILQDGVKLYLDTAKTTGFQFRPAVGNIELISDNPYLSAPAALYLNANTGEDGAGSWLPSFTLTAAGHIIIEPAGGSDLRLAGPAQVAGILRPSFNGTIDLGTNTAKWKDIYVDGLVDSVDVSAIPTTYLALAGGTMTGDLTIQKNNALLKLIDDSGNISLIKGTTSQLCLDADPDDNDAGDTTDIIFKLDGSEVGRFLKGGNFGLGTVLPRKELEVRGSIIAREGFGTELWDVAGGHFETAVQNVEYYSPNPHGGIYGQIYRQYFPATLTGTNPRLDNGNIVVKLIDFLLHTTSGGNKHAVHGFFMGFSTGVANIVHSGSNLSIDMASESLEDGWIDYTK